MDKLVVITGASGGIGAGIALALVQAGAKVVLAARRLEALQHVKDDILQKVPNASIAIHVTDITDKAAVDALIAFAEQTFGNVDVLINNAGVMHFEMLNNVNLPAWHQTIDINCKGTLNGIAAVLPNMLQRKSGHIINITSDAGRKVFPGLGIYSASKMFIEGVSQALRLENVGSGLRVTCIQPGNVATDLVKHASASCGTDAEAMQSFGGPSGIPKLYSEKIVAKTEIECKVLDPKDIGNAVVFAINQPPHVGVHEILIEPRDEPI